jgi:5-methylthioadenosine/S-adenosylhomocysteine deaminase
MQGELAGVKGSALVTDLLLDKKKVDIAISEDGLIAAIGEGVRREYHSSEYHLEGNGAIALPGLINTHTHAAMTLLRGYADDMVLQDWLSQKIWPLEAHLTGDDVYWGTRLACLEMIKTGTVAFNDMYFKMADAARAVDEAGLKAVLSHGFIDLFSEEKRESEIKETEEFCGHVKSLGQPRIKAAVGPHAVYTVSPEGLSWLAEYAGSKNIGIHVHLSETEQEVKDCIRTHGVRPPVLLDRCGVLTPRTVAAHCCWLDEDDCRLLAARGVCASHNPVSNMKLAVHRAMPCHWLSAAGALVALGTDGCASNNNLDLFEEMKAAALLQKFFWNDQTLLSAEEALRMATSAGAKALGFGMGKIEAGAPADLILIDRHLPENTPLHNPSSNLVYACHGSAVSTTICDGRVLMHDRVVPGEEEILKRAGAVAASLVKRASVA